MKKIITKFILIALALSLVFGLCACGNMQVIDTTYEFNYAILNMPDGTIVEGKVESWKDWASDGVQVKIDGITYYTHLSNCVLVAMPEEE